MRFLLCCFLAFLSVPLSAQQKGGASTPTKGVAPAAKGKATAPTLTAEEYRDLILSVADPANSLQHPSQFGSGIERIPDPVTGRVMIYFKFDTAKAKSAADKMAEYQKTWASRRVPVPLEVSHKEILEWIGSNRGRLERVPGLAQGGSLELALFLGGGQNYEELRKKAASALEGMGITLPPVEKKASEGKQ